MSKLSELITTKTGSLKAFARAMDAHGYPISYRTLQYWVKDPSSIKLKSLVHICTVLRCKCEDVVKTLTPEKK
jgi:hypothetical protein